jgi:uncharacterized Fe-S cluster protein YjdI
LAAVSVGSSTYLLVPWRRTAPARAVTWFTSVPAAATASWPGGQQVTVYDNRGICQHSRLCADRLPTTFHSVAEPVRAPSGARMGEIIRAVRGCSSGALSHGIGAVEARTQTGRAGHRRDSGDLLGQFTPWPV